MTPALIIAAIEAAMQLLAFIAKTKEQAVRTGEWTLEEEAAVDKKLAEAFTSPHWKPQP